MPKFHVVRFSEEERDALEGIVKQGRVAAQRRRHAAILLLVDEGKHGSAMTDVEAAERMDCTTQTVAAVRKRCVEKGLEQALERARRSRERTRRLDGEAEAHLVTLACSEPPCGRARWTLRLLADKLVELELVPSVAPETVRQVLKKHHQTLAEADVVHRGGGERGIRLSDGGGARRLQTSLRS